MSGCIDRSATDGGCQVVAGGGQAEPGVGHGHHGEPHQAQLIDNL